MGILAYFFYLLFPAFIVAELGRIQVTSYLGITFFDVISGLTAISYIVMRVIKKKPKFFGSLTIPVLLVISAFTLSLVVNIPRLGISNTLLSSLYLLRWIGFAIILFGLIKANKLTKHKLSEFMVLTGSVLVFLGLLQFLFFNNLKVFFLFGWDDHLYRLFSTFLDPNFAGMFLVMFLFFLFPFLHESYKHKSRTWVFWLILAAATLLSIILTYSRGAYVMLIIGVLAYFFLSKKKLIGVISSIVIIGCIMIFANSGIEGLNLFRTASTNARILSIKNAVTIIEDNPIFGVGFNAFRYAQIRYGFRSDSTPFPTHADSGTDNSFLFIAATSGIIGLVAYLYFLITMLRSVSASKSKFVPIFIVSLISWCVGSLFINGLFYPFMIFWMWCLYAITAESP